MKKIILSNRTNKPLSIFLEPEGSMFNIPGNDFVEISLNEDTLPIELVYDEFENKNILSIWPNKGFPIVLYQGVEILTGSA